MAKTTYQTFTQDTPFSIYREDFIRREALCRALGRKYPGLEATGEEIHEIVVAMDGRRGELQAAEDAQVRARALEDAEKIAVIELYVRTRTIFGLDDKEKATLILPDTPTQLKRLGIKSFGERVRAALANLGTLAEDDPIRLEFLPALLAAQGLFESADTAEDEVRARLGHLGLALTLYKSELSQTREGQLGRIQGLVRDRALVTMFTIPWRKRAKASGDAEADDTTPDEPPPT